MSVWIAALPMYDWPEARQQTDAEWARIRDRYWAAGIAAPENLTRRNAEMPAVPGGIRNDEGEVVAPDPATLPPDELDLGVLWRHPNLIFAQTCWGPMETSNLPDFVEVVAQPYYSAFEGGSGPMYSSAVVMRKGSGTARRGGVAHLPVDLMQGGRLAYNGPDSMSGALALQRDLDALGAGIGIFPEFVHTGSHRASIQAVASGAADVAAIDCRTWAMARRFEPAAAQLDAVGWTSPRRGLPHVVSSRLDPRALEVIRRIL